VTSVTNAVDGILESHYFIPHMWNTRVAKSCAVMLLVAIPLSAICGEIHGAMLFMSKGGAINGFEVTRSAALFDGDKLQLSSDSSASIMASGTSLIMSPGSKLTYKTKSVELQNDSGIAVNTTDGVAVDIDKLRIAPAQKTGKFTVARTGGKVVVLAKLGTVNIADGSSTRTVAEGTSASVSDPQPPQGGATPGVSTGGKQISTTTAILLMLGVAGAAALITYETTGSPSSSH
jgi:hypothetical protein